MLNELDVDLRAGAVRVAALALLTLARTGGALAGWGERARHGDVVEGQAAGRGRHVGLPGHGGDGRLVDSRRARRHRQPVLAHVGRCGVAGPEVEASGPAGATLGGLGHGDVGAHAVQGLQHLALGGTDPGRGGVDRDDQADPDRQAERDEQGLAATEPQLTSEVGQEHCGCTFQLGSVGHSLLGRPVKWLKVCCGEAMVCSAVHSGVKGRSVPLVHDRGAAPRAVASASPPAREIHRFLTGRSHEVAICRR